MSVLRKRDQAAGGGAGSDGPAEDDLAVAYPCLWEHVTRSKYPDGSARVLSTLMLFCDSGVIKACLNDRDQGLTAWASGCSWRACLLALEAGLANDTLDWRAPPSKGKPRR
jgi:hypothetical protein